MALTDITVGTSANDGTGLTLRAAMQLVNSNYDEFYADGTIKAKFCTGTLDDTTPTIAQINTLTGLAPATADTGCLYILKNATVVTYICWSDGANWHVIKATKITS